MKERILPSNFGWVRIEQTEDGYTAYLNNVEAQALDLKDAYTRLLQRIALRLIAGSLHANQNNFVTYYFKSNRTGETIRRNSFQEIKKLAMEDRGTIVIHKSDSSEEKGSPYKVVLSTTIS